VDPLALWLTLSVVSLALLAFTAFVGRKPERIAAAVYLGAWALTLASDELWPNARLISGVLVADVILLLTFVRLSWRTGRSWPAWACGVQALVTMLHVAWAQEPEVGRRAFVAAQNTATLTVLVIMAWGAWRARRTPS
jgi:hypothetical protein